MYLGLAKDKKQGSKDVVAESLILIDNAINEIRSLTREQVTPQRKIDLEDLIQSLEKKCRDLGLPCMSVLGPVLRLFQSYLGAETIHRAGAQHVLNAEYFQRIDALNFTMLHDDGQHAEGLEEADVVLVGVSRTSKTPTSIYLANRGVKTGNVPIVPGVALAPAVEKLNRPLVVGLYASPERIVQIRENRLLGLKAHRDDDQYIDRAAVAEEVASCVG